MGSPCSWLPSTPKLRLRPRLTPLFFMLTHIIPMVIMAMAMVWEDMPGMVATTVLATMEPMLDIMVIPLPMAPMAMESRVPPVLMLPMSLSPVPASVVMPMLMPKLMPMPPTTMEVTMVVIVLILMDMVTAMAWEDTTVDTTEFTLLPTESATTTSEPACPANMFDQLRSQHKMF